MVRKGIHYVIRLLLKLLTRVQAVGLDNIPAEGGCILVSNHLGIIDPVLVFSLLEREDATSLVAKKYQRNPFTRWLINAVDGIWLNRQEADARALRNAVNYLRSGGLLGISPEGTRSPSKALIPAKTGVAYLADKARVPLLPTGITGTERAFSTLARLQRPNLRVHFGSLFELPPLDRTTRDADLQRNTDEIMCRIAALLPPEYRGVYADHPRLRQYL
ncbi:MAG: lysophospholipid acyltransferase family protein [Anaerolineales bacterium]|jgi:1-acyl-sn-glycerol-3-phosphate acyltransferase